MTTKKKEFFLLSVRNEMGGFGFEHQQCASREEAQEWATGSKHSKAPPLVHYVIHGPYTQRPSVDVLEKACASIPYGVSKYGAKK